MMMPGAQPGFGFGPTPVKQAEIRIVVKLRAPRRVLTIWSVGPDGEDDGRPDRV